MKFSYQSFNKLAQAIVDFIKSQPPDLYKMFPRGKGNDIIFEQREVTKDAELFAMFCAAGFIENSWNPPRTFKITPLFKYVVFERSNRLLDEIIVTYRAMGYKKEFDLSHLHRILIEITEDQKIEKYGEIGSHIGSSMSVVAKTNPSIKLFCYDLPNGHSGGQLNTDFFHKKMRDLIAPERCQIFNGDSHSQEIKLKMIENAPYDVFLIDGDHTVTGCLEDFNTVFPLVKKGGKIIIDDLIHHPKLNVLFDNLVNQYNLRSEKFMELNEKDKELGLSLRGVGIIHV